MPETFRRSMTTAFFTARPLITRFGTTVFYDIESLTLTHAEQGSSRRTPLYCLVSSADEAFGLLVDGQGSLMRRMVLSVEDAEGARNLRDAETGLFMSAIPAGDGPIELNREVADEWERFWLVTPPDAVSSINDSLTVHDMLFGLLNGQIGDLSLSTLDRLEQLSLSVVEKLCSELLKREHVDTIAVNLARRHELVLLFGKLFKGDPWAGLAIPELLDRVRSIDDDPQKSRSIGPELDELIFAGVKSPWSFSMAVNFSLRQNASPNQKACIIATARNEGVYLIDWIAHHRAIGFTGFIIYTNNNDDGSDELLQRLADAGEIDLVFNEVGEHIGPQGKSYAHALQLHSAPLNFQWAAIIDLDEFIQVNPLRYGDIARFLDHHALLGSDSIGLNWTINFPNGHSTWIDKPVVDRFPFSRSDIHIKSIFKPHRFMNSHSHYPYDVPNLPRCYRYANGDLARAYPFNETPEYGHAWISHFYFKSIEEFFERRMRRQADLPLDLGVNDDRISDDAIARYLDVYFVRESSSEAPKLPSVKGAFAERQRLLGIKGVDEAARNVKAIYGQRLDDVRQRITFGARYLRCGTPPSQIRDVLLGQDNPEL